MGYAQTGWLNARTFCEKDTGHLIAWAAIDAPDFLGGREVHHNAPKAAEAVDAFLRVAVNDQNTYLAVAYSGDERCKRECIFTTAPAACVIVTPDNRIGAIHVESGMANNKHFMTALQEWVDASGYSYKSADVIEMAPRKAGAVAPASQAAVA